MKSILGAALAVLMVRTPAEAQEWTRFRGPNGTGISEAKDIPVTWTEKDFRWRATLPGEGHSQPVIWGDRLFLTSASKDKGAERYMLCLHASDGKELWQKKLPLPTQPPRNKGRRVAQGTPPRDKDRVYACFASEEKFLVKAWDHAGKEVWTEDLGPFVSQHGHGASPILFEDKLIVTNDQDADSFIVALDSKTGKTVWKCPRRGVKENTAYGTPCILERPGKPTEILTTSHAHGVSSLDAKTGKMLWEAKPFDKRSVISPVVVGDLVFGSCGSGAYTQNFLVAVKLDGKGDVTSSNIAYTLHKGAPYVPTPVAVGNRLFLIDEKGIASAIEAPTGKVVWTERINGGFYGSPVVIDGKIYCCSTQGDVVVYAAADEFKLLSRNPLGEGSESTPCVAGGRLYLRTFSHLVCVGSK
jgi:outer membrane protein assembly factor BamB